MAARTQAFDVAVLHRDERSEIDLVETLSRVTKQRPPGAAPVLASGHLQPEGTLAAELGEREVPSLQQRTL
jgi:hypothetical protein